MNLTGEQRAWYLKWPYAKPQREPAQEAERFKFLREFRIPVALELLHAVEAWPASASEPEPGEIEMQRLFRLIFLKQEGRGEVRRVY